MIMTQEDRQLLLKDLSARLPYNPIVRIRHFDGDDYENYLYADYLDKMMSYSIRLKPYLRPMSSMTEEESKDYIKCKYSSGKVIELRKENGCNIGTDIKLMWLDVFDWLNAHHFDYRGLIPMGLAIEAPKGMYNFN